MSLGPHRKITFTSPPNSIETFARDAFFWGMFFIGVSAFGAGLSGTTHSIAGTTLSTPWGHGHVGE